MMMHLDNLMTLPLIPAVISLKHRCCCMLINDLLLKLEPVSFERLMSFCLIIIL
jgi:hypothetical protein